MYFYAIYIVMVCLSFFSAEHVLGHTSISKTPCAIGYTPDSVLSEEIDKKDIRYAGNRPRISTCSSAAWFLNDRYIFAIQMQTASMQIWEFVENDGQYSLTPIRSISEGMELNRPEGAYVSKNNKLIVIPTVNSGTKIFNADETNFIDTNALAILPGQYCHGAQFSPDGKYVAYTCTGENARVNIYKIVVSTEKYKAFEKVKGKYKVVEKEKEKLEFVHNQTYTTQFQPLCPKSIDFTKDSRYVVIGHCRQVRNFKGKGQGLLTVHRYNKEEGTIDPNPVSITEEDLYSTETVAFSPDDSAVFVVDQINDRVTGHVFNRKTGELGKNWVALKNPEANLSLPHGISFSRDGRHVAVTSYGDDKLTVYKVK